MFHDLTMKQDVQKDKSAWRTDLATEQKADRTCRIRASNLVVSQLKTKNNLKTKSHVTHLS